MAFSTRYLGEYRTEIRLDLSDGSTLFSDNLIDRSVQRAVYELSRHYPLEQAYELTLSFTVEDEESTAPAAGTWTDLTYKPIKPGSVTVTDSTGGTTYVLDTDYTMDYQNGRYTIITGGDITAEDTLIFDYTRSRTMVDISAIISALIRITHVEYPAGELPQQKVSYSVWNSFLIIGSQIEGKSQENLADGKHLVIFYEAMHTAPLAAAAPSYESFLDEVICLGAEAYALLAKAIELEHQAVTDLASTRTELALTTAIHALVATALGKITTQTGLAATALGNVSLSDAGTALAAANTILDAVLTTSIDKATTGAEAYLDTGDGNINAVNLGAEVAGQYANYARTRVEIAQSRVATALGYVQEALDRIQSMQLYPSIASEYNRSAEAFVAEAQSRITEISQHLSEAAQFIESANSDMTLADRFRAEGQIRLNKFEELVKSRSEWRKRVSNVSVRQNP